MEDKKQAKEINPPKQKKEEQKTENQKIMERLEKFNKLDERKGDERNS